MIRIAHIPALMGLVLVALPGGVQAGQSTVQQDGVATHSGVGGYPGLADIAPVNDMTLLTQAHQDGDMASPFPLDQAMDEEALRALAGGTGITVDLGALGVNVAESNGIVHNASADGSQTGSVYGNIVSGNSGFTTVLINTGNNVVFQNTMQVNVFTGLGGQ